MNEDKYQQISADGSGARKSLGSEDQSMASSQREVLRRHLASAAGKTPSVSLSLFLQINSLEVEQAVWTGIWEDDMRGASKRLAWEATSWTRVRGLAGAVLGEMKDLTITVPSLQVLKLEDGRMIGMKETRP